MILYIILILLIIFAIVRENAEYNDSFILGKYEKNDTIDILLKKLKICISYDFTTIKWRRIFLASVFACVLIFFIIHGYIPKLKDILLYLLLIFLSITIMWYSYIDKTVKEVNKYCNENILHIYKILNNKKK
jgi:hypothetical protein